jgi:hypothetical protein
MEQGAGMTWCFKGHFCVHTAWGYVFNCLPLMGIEWWLYNFASLMRTDETDSEARYLDYWFGPIIISRYIPKETVP